jgi:ribosomal-protein-alanine N-acetyltransferase
MTIRIRSMTLDDIQAVHSIDELSFSMPWPERSYRYEIMENPTSRLWVAEIHHAYTSKSIVGMIVVWMILDEVHIATLAVHPDFRGRGIAKKLLVVSLREAIERDIQLATLEVRANNQAAQDLYKSFGFVESGRRLRYYRDNNEDALILTLYGLGKDHLSKLNGVDESNIEVEYCNT